MSRATSPFAGIKLSEQRPVTPPGIDQRLFGPTPPNRVSEASTEPAQPSNQVTKVPTLQPSNQGSLEPRNQGTKEHRSEPLPSLDINTPAYKNNTFAFTREELEAIEDTKLELQRRFDLPATKNDIVRCAIHQLLADYRDSHQSSFLVQALQRKRAR